MTVAIFYNFWAIILRIAFLEVRSEPLFCTILWPLDMVTDIMYLSDIWLQLRKAFRDDQGIMINDPIKMALNYTSNLVFVTDVLSVIPSETIGLLLSGDHSPLFRIPRLFKWQCIVEFFEVSDLRTSKPNRLRAFKLTLYLGMAIHWVACVYYMISEYEGLGSNSWVYPAASGKDGRFSRKYIKSLYWSILTLTTIGETPEPITNLEHVFTSFMFLLGIFVFAAVVGNVGDVISNMNAARTDFQIKMDYIKWFMEHHGVPVSVQQRAKKWAYYAWSRAHAFHEGDAMDMLPQRLRAEIAIHVHLATLKKVKIFKDCDEGLLCELVLKLRPQIFSPGDYICRCREIGREMYIINRGKVEIIVPDATTGEQVVVACLAEGNYFGEISLLKLDGGRNRRSADVRSVGYSELLCLSQRDLMEALEEYPDAKAVLEIQGRDRLQRTKSEALKLPGNRADKKEELQLNFAREIKEIQDVIEELRKAHELEYSQQITKEQSSENMQLANRTQKLDKLQERVSALSSSTSSETQSSTETITVINNDNKDVSDSQTIQNIRLTSSGVTQSHITNQSTIRYRNRQSAEKLLTRILRVAQEAASKRNEENPKPVECNITKREETEFLKRDERLRVLNSSHRCTDCAGNDVEVTHTSPPSSKERNVVYQTKVCLTPKITLDNDIDGHCCLQPHRRYSISLPVETKENGAMSCNSSCPHYHQI
ncbi:cyclic nucleotide-gated cation channel alpha-3-like isoform X2 [Actinia tenebrosa]|nr:cyclic nucleotide-gated cation channel alpha-3-like isoform X2 [Actinia tenebrosa]